MSELVLKAQVRTGRGKGNARKLRELGYIPSVLYGKDISDIKIFVLHKELEKVMRAGGEGGLISLKVLDEERGNIEYPVMLRDIQTHPLKNEYTHADFYQVSLKDKLETEISIQLIGEALGTKEGGVLQQYLRTVEVECLPTAIPEKFELDISNVALGDNITVESLTAPDGVEIITSGETVIASVNYPQAETEEDEASPGEGEAEEADEADEGDKEGEAQSDT